MHFPFRVLLIPSGHALLQMWDPAVLCHVLRLTHVLLRLPILRRHSVLRLHRVLWLLRILRRVLLLLLPTVRLRGSPCSGKPPRGLVVSIRLRLHMKTVRRELTDSCSIEGLAPPLPRLLSDLVRVWGSGVAGQHVQQIHAPAVAPALLFTEQLLQRFLPQRLERLGRGLESICG